MAKIPAWAYLATALVLVLVIGVRQSMQAAYYRGIANDAEQRVEVQESVIDSVTETTTRLAEELEQAAFNAEQQRRTTEREVVRLGMERIEARQRAEALTARLRAELDSALAIDLDSIVINYEIQVASLDSMLVVERRYRVAEALRADRATALTIGLQNLVTEHVEKDIIQDMEIRALRESMSPSLGLRLKADWWLGVAGVAAGYVIWGTR